MNPLPDVDIFFFEILHKNNDVYLQGNILDSLNFRTKKFAYTIDIKNFETFIIISIEKIYKYNATIIVLRDSFDPSNNDKTYEKRYYSLLIDELTLRVRLIQENIFKALRVSYPDDPGKKYYFRKYYYDLLSQDRIRKDNTTTVLENILPKNLYLEIYNLFTIVDFENKNKDQDFKRITQTLYSGFILSEKNLLEFLVEEDPDWLKQIIIDYGQEKGGKDMLERMDRVNFLKKTGVFKEVPGEVLFLLADKATEKIYHAGDYIVKKGDVVDSLFIIYKGEAQVLVGEDEKMVAVIGEKEVLGEIELFRDVQKRLAVASVRAKSDEVLCIRIKKNDFDEVFESNIELARALIKSMGERLERMNEKVQGMEKKSISGK